MENVLFNSYRQTPYVIEMTFITEQVQQNGKKEKEVMSYDFLMILSFLINK